MMDPQISTHPSVLVPTLVSLNNISLSGPPQALVRLMIIYLSTHKYVGEQQRYPIQILSPLLRATRRLLSHQDLEDRPHPLHNRPITPIHLDHLCRQKFH